MNILKKCIAVLLTLACILPLCVGCKQEKESDDTTDAVSTVETGDGLYDANGYLLDSLPELDYDGKVVNVLTWTEQSQWDWNMTDDISTKINTALFNRQTNVGERLNVSFNVLTEGGAYANRVAYVEKIRSSVSSGASDAFDMIGLHPASAASATLAGYFCDLSSDEFTYIDYEKPWWPDDILEACRINNKLYFTTGDISTTSIRSMSCMILNLDIYGKYYKENIYDIIDSGAWTMEKFKELSVGTFGTGADGYYSTTITSHVEFDNLFYGAGFKYLRLDADGDLIISEDLSDQRTADYFQTCYDLLWHNEDVALMGIDAAFTSEYSMWHMGYLSDIQDGMRDVTFNFAIAPYPKFNAEQQEYYTVNGWYLTSYAVPINVGSKECSSAIMEALASESYRTVTPAVYEESFKYRYLDTPENAAVFDLLHDTLVFDTGRFFVDHIDKIGYAFRKAAEENSNWSSSLNIPGWGRTLRTLLQKFN